MAALIIKAAAAVAAVTGLAFSADQNDADAYADSTIKSLSIEAVAENADILFARADFDANGAMSVDEYTALSVVTAELARLNGFVVVETRDEPATISISARGRSMTESEQIRVAAVARNNFYQFAGEDGKMSSEEFTQAKAADFNAADLNGDTKLGRRELGLFANSTARLIIDA